MKNLVAIFQRFMMLLQGLLMIILGLLYPKRIVKPVSLFAFTIKTKNNCLINLVWYEEYGKIILELGPQKTLALKYYLIKKQLILHDIFGI